MTSIQTGKKVKIGKILFNFAGFIGHQSLLCVMAVDWDKQMSSPSSFYTLMFIFTAGKSTKQNE